MRRRAKPAKTKVEAGLPVGLGSPENEGARVHDLEKRLTEALKREAEALEQQTATSAILRVISSSPTDVQPVFEAIVQNAVQLCEAANGTVFRFDGSLIHVASAPQSRCAARVGHALGASGQARHDSDYPSCSSPRSTRLRPALLSASRDRPRT